MSVNEASQPNLKNKETKAVSDILLACTVCGTSNVLPASSANVLKGTNMTTFCKTCGGATIQRVVVSYFLGDPSKDSVDALAAPGKSSADSYSQASETDMDESIWRRLQDALVNSGVSMEEFFRCDTSTRARLISAVGFNSAEIPRLLEFADANATRSMLSNVMGRMQNPFETTAAATLRIGAVAGEQATNPGPMKGVKNRTSAEFFRNSAQDERVFVNTPNHSAQIDGSMLSLKMQEDGTLIARCSVYPHLPAEFWCSLCGVLVSSRCHVSGIHKDHPFITLRQAAEAHVRDLSTWSERCRNQLNVANTIISNLQHGRDVLNDSAKHEEEALDRHFEEIVQGLTQWCQGLKSSMRLQIDAQLENINVAIKRTNKVIEYYAERLKRCDPLLQSIPPMHQVDKKSEDWSLRVMDLVSQLKTASQEPIPMPRITVPEVKSFATVTTYMELLKAVSVPAGIRIPDVLDTGYLNFPTPSVLGRETFTLDVPKDAKTRGILIYSGRTLTRSQDITPTHSLVCASQIFYTGITAWEVHVDRLGAGPGRILAGVLMAGTDGEGVVWDGQRIVGPNEGECRALSERYRIKTGTTLRFVLELEAPSYFLVCYYEDEVVARVPLPPALNGWIPAFSVFGPQDQLTVVPISAAVAENLLTDAKPEEKKKREEEMKVRLGEQEQRLNALHQQLLAVNSRIDQDQYEKLNHASHARQEIRGDGSNDKGDADPSILSSPFFWQVPPQVPGDGYQSANNKHRLDSLHGAGAVAATGELTSPSPLLAPNLDSGQRNEKNKRNASYSPELQNLLNFVDSIK
ncbi:hypothetical protein TCDM_02895 [Trypanosoma cruzi Dm28c]|uniref:B box-type domain-containing protein n=2 Tax=Trypanosoma cruzi TaxID=5693 RepID=V5BQ77_TRYCR|nr:hypothetical protein TCDM_02895 [Trypanosoma cruzi Dm28c]PBJ75360.1 hypothetical protein BCY84_11185 [Trypanosoma cruzi cruzi]PWU97821.1 hypothetical protein C4B63_14g180 [Trypanosoma cruzi]